MVALFLFLLTFDTALLGFAVAHVYAYGVSGKVLFISEYTILITALGNVTAKYGINLWERLREMRAARELERARAAGEVAEDEEDEDRAWEGKSMVVFYVDLVSGKSQHWTTTCM